MPPQAGVAAVAVGIIEEWPRMRPIEPLPIDCVFEHVVYDLCRNLHE